MFIKLTFKLDKSISSRLVFIVGVAIMKSKFHQIIIKTNNSSDLIVNTQ